MDTDIRPGLRRLVHALRHGADVSAVMLRILDDAEQAAARIDWSGGGDAAAPRPDTTDTPTFVGVGAPGLAFAPLGAVVAAVQNAIAQTPPPPSPPRDAHGRSQRYLEWTSELFNPNNFRGMGGITFYLAAARVTSLLGYLDNPVIRRILRDTVGGLVAYDFDRAAMLLTGIGERLYALNAAIRAALPSSLRASGVLYGSNGFTSTSVPLLTATPEPDELNYIASPLAGETVDGQEFPDDLVVVTAVDWDIHMVWREQAEVEAYLEEHGITPEVLNAVNLLLNGGAEVVHPEGLLQGFIPSNSATIELIAQARVAMGGELDFSNVEHRRAMGIALVMSQQGYTSEEYLYYMQRQAEHIAGPLPVDETLRYSGPNPLQAPPSNAERRRQMFPTDPRADWSD